MKKLYGTYLNQEEADLEVEKILKEGYKKEDILILRKKEFEEYIDTNSDINKEFLEKYKGILKEEQVVILVESQDESGRDTPDWDEREKEFYEKEN